MIDIEKLILDLKMSDSMKVAGCHVLSREIYNDVHNVITELERLQKKEIPMKPIVYEDEHAFECSNCLKHGVKDSMWLFTEIGEYDYCPRCGQKLDWSDEK